MYILGISCFYHDSAAAILKDGKLMAAIEEEKLSRKKHDFGFPAKAVDYCLKQAGVSINDIDYVIFYEKPFLKFERILKTVLSSFPYSLKMFQDSSMLWLKERLWIKALIKESLNYKGEILFSTHHMSHAASCFLASPFEESAIVTLDGVGEWATLSVGIGRGKDIEIKKQINFPHSLGLLYSVFTAFLGFKVNNGEYKVMGMAPYGEPIYTDKIYKMIKVEEDGSFKLNMDYFSYHKNPSQIFSRKFLDEFGRPQDPKETENLNKYYCDIAASVQKVLEDVLLKIISSVYKEYGIENLCMAGGVALNSVANAKILKNTGFKQIFIQPQAGDGGGALGAALYLCNTVLGKERVFVQDHAYYGPEYSNEEIRKFLEEQQINYEELEMEAVFKRAADYLAQGKVLGWFQGKMEWGPRALGNRSILADPRRKDMKDIVNRKIKFREPFRPFAPSVLSDKAFEWFDLGKAENSWPLRFMLYVIDVKRDKKELIPAITHVDGTARPQLVFQKDNPCYYSLIEEFYKRTGVPLVLNTSFNLRGEPIVCSPADAFNTFSKSGIDILILNNFLIKKNG